MSFNLLSSYDSPSYIFYSFFLSYITHFSFFYFFSFSLSFFLCFSPFNLFFCLLSFFYQLPCCFSLTFKRYFSITSRYCLFFHSSCFLGVSEKHSYHFFSVVFLINHCSFIYIFFFIFCLSYRSFFILCFFAFIFLFLLSFPHFFLLYENPVSLKRCTFCCPIYNPSYPFSLFSYFHHYHPLFRYLFLLFFLPPIILFHYFFILFLCFDLVISFIFRLFSHLAIFCKKILFLNFLLRFYCHYSCVFLCYLHQFSIVFFFFFAFLRFNLGIFCLFFLNLSLFHSSTFFIRMFILLSSFLISLINLH